MCFSAAASFTVAATTAAIGVAALRHVNHWREIPLAVVPLLFAVQQTMEGLLWLQLPDTGEGGSTTVLAFGFLILAKVLWPVYTAVSVLLIEPDQSRQRVLGGVAVAGMVLSLYLLVGLLGSPVSVAIRGHSIDYAGGVNPLSWELLPYLFCVCAPLFLSSQGSIRLLGALVLAGFLVSAYAYVTTFVSVWCFFAAADSTILYFYFKRASLKVRLRRY